MTRHSASGYMGVRHKKKRYIMSLAHAPYELPEDNGDAQIIPFPLRPVLEVSKHDLRNFGRHIMWVQRYISFLYDKGDRWDSPVPKADMRLAWKSGQIEAQAGGLDRWARQRMRPEDYQRSTKFFISCASDGVIEELNLEITPFFRVKGSYRWQAAGSGDDLSFAGIEEAHRQKATRRGAAMLELFRDDATKSHGLAPIEGLWRVYPQPMPDEIRKLPDFVTQD